MPMMKTAGYLLEDPRLALLAGQVGIAGQQVLGVDERDLFGQVRVAIVVQLREQLVGVRLSAAQDAPDGPHDLLEECRGCAARAVMTFSQSHWST